MYYYCAIIINVLLFNGSDKFHIDKHTKKTLSFFLRENLKLFVTKRLYNRVNKSISTILILVKKIILFI